MEIEDMIGEGTKWWSGSPDRNLHGDFNGIPATGKKISDSGIVIFRVEDHRIVESWISRPSGVLQQMGVVPEKTCVSG
jgi:predicted ester cyclase